jgi:NADH-quinone oxidoreductase subunit N
MGFILVGLSLNLKESIEVGLFYLIVYIVLNTGLFATLILFIKNRYGKELIYIQELSEIYKSNNTLGIIFGLNLFSLIGLPPLAGFLSKAYVLILLVQNNLYSISIFIVIMSVITSVYYLRLIKIVFFNKEDWNNTIALNSESSLLIIYAITLFNFGLILHVDYVLKLINIISLNLYY